MCGCLKADATHFHLEHFEELRAQWYMMTHDELNMVLIGSPVTPKILKKFREFFSRIDF